MTMLQDAISELGVVEGKGSKNDPRVLAYHAVTGEWSDDSVAWCGSFIAWVGQKNKVKFSKWKAARARYWITDWITEGHGKLIKQPIPGAIGVVPRGKSASQGHVFMFVRWLDKTAGVFEAIGGNQGGGRASGHDGAVTLTKMKAADVLGWSWPANIPLPSSQKPYRKSESILGGATTLGAGGLLTAGTAPELAKSIEVLTQPKHETVAEVIQESGGSLINAVDQSATARASGTIFGAVVAVIIIAAAVWIIVSRINNARKDRAIMEG